MEGLGDGLKRRLRWMTIVIGNFKFTVVFASYSIGSGLSFKFQSHTIIYVTSFHHLDLVPTA